MLIRRRLAGANRAPRTYGREASSGEQVHHIRVPTSAGERIAWLHSRGEVLEQKLDHDEMELSVRLSPDNWARFQALESA
jgi:GTP-binding protein HflX